MKIFIFFEISKIKSRMRNENINFSRSREKFLFLLSLFLTRSRLSSMPGTLGCCKTLIRKYHGPTYGPFALCDPHTWIIGWGPFWIFRWELLWYHEKGKKNGIFSPIVTMKGNSFWERPNFSQKVLLRLGGVNSPLLLAPYHKICLVFTRSLIWSRIISS